MADKIDAVQVLLSMSTFCTGSALNRCDCGSNHIGEAGDSAPLLCAAERGNASMARVLLGVDGLEVNTQDQVRTVVTVIASCHSIHIFHSLTHSACTSDYLEVCI